MKCDRIIMCWILHSLQMREPFLLYRMIITGWRRALTVSDLWSLNPRDRSQMVAPKLAKNWQHQLDKAK